MSKRFSAAVVAASILTLAAGCSKPPVPKAPPVPVIVAAVQRTSVPYTVTTNGVVEPMQTVAIEAQVGGILTNVAFAEGQDVHAGQVLFQIDARPYVAALDQARGQLARDQAQAANAKRDASRYSVLVQQDYVTRSQADQAQATAASAGATVDADRAAVEKAQLDVSNATIRAPISGRTGGLLVRRGNLVKANASTPLVVINQIQPILVRFSVPQAQLPDIQRYFGDARPLAVQATPSEGSGTPLNGTLAFVDNNVDSTTGTVMLKARFANQNATLWPGQYVTVALRLYVDPNALTVPSAAVLTGQQGTYVFTADNTGKAKQQPVRVVRTVDTLTVIGGGLSIGDSVIVDGQSRLVPGSKIVIKPPTSVSHSVTTSAATPGAMGLGGDTALDTTRNTTRHTGRNTAPDSARNKSRGKQ